MYPAVQDEGKFYADPTAVVNIEGGSAVEEDTEDEDDEETPPVKLPLAIQTYSPQLNLSLYSPSVASVKPSRLYAPSCLHDTSSPIAATAAVQNPTRKKSPLDSFSSTIKMDIRSPPPPQPSQSTSRLMNAFQRLKKTSQRNAHVNTVVPSECIKPSPSKSSLADKIKNKFQTKKKPAAVVVQKSMARSSSFSSIRHWSTSSSKGHAKTEKMTKSTSARSFPTSSFSSSSSESTGSTSAPNSHFTMTKSISSHRLYKSTATITTRERPRQALRAVNPNDSIRGEKKKSSVVRFSKLVSVRDTYSKIDYDRESDPEAVCTRLTPTMAQQIKEELNAYKLHEMQVHEYSRVHTHFFL